VDPTSTPVPYLDPRTGQCFRNPREADLAATQREDPSSTSTTTRRDEMLRVHEPALGKVSQLVIHGRLADHAPGPSTVPHEDQ